MVKRVEKHIAMALKLTVCDRNYEKWTFTASMYTLNACCDINPLTQKLFTQDIINPDGTLIHSPYRSNTEIPGILVVDGNTYGRANIMSNHSKLLYICIPNDKALPLFLVQYAHNCNTFKKEKINKYITFKIKEWTAKHPIGILTNTLGEVDIKENFYQYQLCCKGLNTSIAAFTKATLTVLKIYSREKMMAQIKAAAPDIEDRRMQYIFSIDPAGSKDIDDAIGLTVIDEQNVRISVYIANIALLIDYLQLWAFCTERTSTIYLPTGKLPMLPNVLSDDFGSLLQHQDRYAFTMDLQVRHGTEIIAVDFKRTLIKVQKNYAYEEQALLTNKAYQHLFALTKQLALRYRYVDTITDSHEVIEFYMICMNYESSKVLRAKGRGIFRTAQLKDEGGAQDEVGAQDEAEGQAPLPVLSKDLRKFITIINATSGKYCKVEHIAPHDLIGEGLSSYVHITSPIRRLVDLVNLIEMQQEYLTAEAHTFRDEWLMKIADINTQMKAIRTVQNACNLLDRYSKEPEKTYSALCFNKTVNTEDTWKYAVYIPELKMLSTIKTPREIANYSLVEVSAHFFTSEATMKKKIRLQLV